MIVNLKFPFVHRTRTTVVVLGMHRSGTSMVAGVLRELGVHMGDDLLPAYRSNPLGHFENRVFVELNDRILAACESSWDSPPLPQTIAATGEDFTGEIKKLVNRHNRRYRVWGWKDPRTVLTLPLYAPFLTNARIVVCRRRCEDAARSLTRRDGSELRKNQDLCRLYNDRLDSLVLNTSLPILELDYEECRSAPQKATNELNRFVGTMAGAKILEVASELILDSAGLVQARDRLPEEPGQ